MQDTEARAVGIDLGTTFTVVAHINAAGSPEAIPNAEGDYLTPSVVLFEEHGVTVGKEALKAAALEPGRYVDFAKRDMGNTAYHRSINGKQVPPEVIQSIVLRKVTRDAEAKIGPIDRAVITVPAYFNEPRRKATQDAGRLAGLEVLDIINEPTAAAIAFGCRGGFLDDSGRARRRERILVYDLGGGTFDVTLMEIEGDEFRTLATDGDVYLGGTDWDRRLVDHVAERFKQKHGVDPRDREDGLRRLLREAEDAKRALSTREQVTVSFEHAGQGIRLPVTREEFEDLAADLLERTLFTTRQVLRDAKLTWKDLTRLLIVGGSTRMPAVRQALERESGLTVDQSLSADEAVAHGAALYAEILLSTRPAPKHSAAAGTQKPDPTVPPGAGPAPAPPKGASPRPRAVPVPKLSIRDVNSHNLGVMAKDAQTGRPRNVVLIPRNTPLPASSRKRFQTVRDDQQTITVHIVEGGDSAGRSATEIGTCVVRDLPPKLPKGTPVDVLFSYAANGRLKVKARLLDPEREATLVLDRATGLSDDSLSQWKKRLERRQGPLRD